MGITNLIKTIDRAIASLENDQFYDEMNKVSSQEEFEKIISSKSKSELKDIEEGIIYRISNSNIKNKKVSKSQVKAADEFMVKYNKYISKKLDEDVRQYYNNDYCKNVYQNVINSLPKELRENSLFPINNKKIGNIEHKIITKYKELMNDIVKNKKLSAEDRHFLEELFIDLATNGGIAKKDHVMTDIVNYFNRYPIKDFNEYRNKALFIMSITSKKLLKNNKNCAFKLMRKDAENDKLFKISHPCQYTIVNGNVPCLEIYNVVHMADDDIREFLDGMCDIFRHIKKFADFVDFDLLDKEYKNTLLLENMLIANKPNFYKIYHNSFTKEIIAKKYAIAELKKYFKKKYLMEVTEIESRIKNENRIDAKEFSKMELQEYSTIIIENLKEEF